MHDITKQMILLGFNNLLISHLNVGYVIFYYYPLTYDQKHSYSSRFLKLSVFICFDVNRFQKYLHIEGWLRPHSVQTQTRLVRGVVTPLQIQRPEIACPWIFSFHIQTACKFHFSI